MNMAFWKKALVQICIGVAVGFIVAAICKGNWEVLPGWITGLFCSIGWKMSISESEFQKKEADYWKNMWMNGRSIELDDGFGETEVNPPRRYATQAEISERWGEKRIMEFDFTEEREQK